MNDHKQNMIDRYGSWEAYIEKKRAAARKGGTAPHKVPPGYGSTNIGVDGLTGPERAKKHREQQRSRNARRAT